MEINSSPNKLDNIKSYFILKKVFENLQIIKSLLIIKYNKKIQKRLNVDIQNYEKHCQIEIEVIPLENNIGPFINFININEDEDEKYYHIYFNNNYKEEIKRQYLYYNEKIENIKIIIDYQVKSLYKLFYDCKRNYSISFKRFNKNNIINMNKMFSRCPSLKQLDYGKYVFWLFHFGKNKSQ